MLLTVCLPTFRTSRSFWKFPTVSPTSVWQFIGSGERCFWMNWISKSFLWALHRWSIYYSRSSFDLFCHFHGFIFIWLLWLCSKLLVYVITFPLLCVFQTGDWTWLKEFYQRLIDQKWQRKKKSKERWYQKAILSKFLYYRWVEFAFLKWCEKIILTVTLNNFLVYSSINGDGAAEPVSDTFSEEDKNLDEDFSCSWPTTLTSTQQTGAEQSDGPKQVQHFGFWIVIQHSCNQIHQNQEEKDNCSFWVD